MPRQEQLGLSIGYEPAWVVTNRIMGGQLRDKAWKGHVISRFRFGKIEIRYKSIQRTLQNFCLQGLLIKVCGPVRVILFGHIAMKWGQAPVIAKVCAPEKFG